MLEVLAMAELNPDGSVNTDYGDNGISPISKESGTPGIADDGSAVIPLDAVDVSGVNPVTDFPSGACSPTASSIEHSGPTAKCS